mmetsp:Transcript_13476/g.30565  ORF Transcript_13476/g.30565 Transcript_13476/m.30565 type:complete len:238 (-) Transcript_13476:459-1172(-)
MPPAWRLAPAPVRLHRQAQLRAGQEPGGQSCASFATTPCTPRSSCSRNLASSPSRGGHPPAAAFDPSSPSFSSCATSSPRAPPTNNCHNSSFVFFSCPGGGRGTGRPPRAIQEGRPMAAGHRGDTHSREGSAWASRPGVRKAREEARTAAGRSADRGRSAAGDHSAARGHSAAEEAQSAAAAPHWAAPRKRWATPQLLGRTPLAPAAASPLARAGPRGAAAAPAGWPVKRPAAAPHP